MSVLPNPQTGNSHTDFLFRLVDEKLSELFGIHGQANFRIQPYSQSPAVLDPEVPRYDQFTGGFVPTTRQVIAGSGLGGGGNLASDVTLTVNAGSAISTAGDAVGVIAGAGITVGANNVALTTTGVTPGSYTNTDLTVDAYGRITAAASGMGVSDHGLLLGLLDDDHPQYSLADGTRAFTGVVAGVTPVLAAHLVTKDYVDTKLWDRLTSLVGAGSTFVLTDDASNQTLTGNLNILNLAGNTAYQFAASLRLSGTDKIQFYDSFGGIERAYLVSGFGAGASRVLDAWAYSGDTAALAQILRLHPKPDSGLFPTRRAYVAAYADLIPDVSLSRRIGGTADGTTKIFAQCFCTTYSAGNNTVSLTTDNGSGTELARLEINPGSAVSATGSITNLETFTLTSKIIVNPNLAGTGNILTLRDGVNDRWVISANGGTEHTIAQGTIVGGNPRAYGMTLINTTLQGGGTHDMFFVEETITTNVSGSPTIRFLYWKPTITADTGSTPSILLMSGQFTLNTSGTGRYNLVTAFHAQMPTSPVKMVANGRIIGLNVAARSVGPDPLAPSTYGGYGAISAWGEAGVRAVTFKELVMGWDIEPNGYFGDFGENQSSITDVYGFRYQAQDWDQLGIGTPVVADGREHGFAIAADSNLTDNKWLFWGPAVNTPRTSRTAGIRWNTATSVLELSVGTTTKASLSATLLDVVDDVRGRQMVADGDNAGIVGTNSMTSSSDLTANSSGVGTILFKGTTSRNSSGFIKFYIGGTAYYVPVFSAITG